MNRFILTLTLLLSTTIIFASERPDYSKWTTLLERHVTSSGNVNYKGFMDDIHDFDEFLIELREKAPQGDWSSAEKKAFYINAYNAYTIKFIITKYPVKSPKDCKFSGKDLWHFKMVLIGPQRYTLDWIENGILRKMGDPRIHFAINCASYSCPKLMNEAFVPEKMEQQLNQVTRSFVNDPSKNRFERESIQLSELFKWYRKDFTKEGSLLEYINQFLKNPINMDADIDFLDYDWSLNDAK